MPAQQYKLTDRVVIPLENGRINGVIRGVEPTTIARSGRRDWVYIVECTGEPGYRKVRQRTLLLCN